MKIFHIVIFSRLQSYDGGRETWLNMFLPLLSNGLNNTKIHIYYISDTQSDKSNMINMFDDNRFEFHEVKLPDIKNKISSIYRILLFAKKTIFLINSNITKNSEIDKENIVLGIGSFYEAFVLMTHKFIYANLKGKYMVWLRGVWAKETLARHSGFIHKAIIFTEKIFLDSADMIIANGKDTAKAYKEYGYDSVVIPNALDLDRYANVKNMQDKEKKIISYIGRLSKEKGLLDFLKSIEVFNRKYPELKEKITFQIAGDGPLKEEVFKANFDNFEYLGPISNEKIIDYIESITCGVALTYSKSALGGAGVSNGLLELMAAGRIIICWKSPVFEQVLDESSALMIEESDFEALASCYKNLIDDFNKLFKLSECAKEISKNYSQENHIKQFLRLIDNES